MTWDRSRFWWLLRVTLVDLDNLVAFGMPQNFGRWWGPMNGTLSFYEYRLSGGDTQGVGMLKHLPRASAML